MARSSHCGEHVHGENGQGFDSTEMVEYAALEGEVLHGLATHAADAVFEISEQRGLAVRRILDIGSGPGLGTIALAYRFPSVQLVAIDGLPAMLNQLQNSHRPPSIRDN